MLAVSVRAADQMLGNVAVVFLKKAVAMGDADIGRLRSGFGLPVMILGSLAVVIGLLSDGVWALLASRLRSWFNASPARGRGLTTTGGVSMIGLGLAVAASGRPD